MKCQFAITKVLLLGHLMSRTGIKSDLKSLDAICNVPILQLITNIPSFLGSISYLLDNHSYLAFSKIDCSLYIRMACCKLIYSLDYSWEDLLVAVEYPTAPVDYYSAINNNQYLNLT
uniref:Uncharacterized protein n=1 Tax=Romanomermis culicivorax TaxID=13658 RepID=A0A915JLB3_ROMCU